MVSELIAPGEISFHSDPQIGKAVIMASLWEQARDRVSNCPSLRRPRIVNGEAIHDTRIGYSVYFLIHGPEDVVVSVMQSGGKTKSRE